MTKKKKKYLRQICTPSLVLFVILGLLLHVSHTPEMPGKITITFTVDSVSINENEFENYGIEYDSVPGTLVLIDGYRIIAFVNPDCYWAEKQSPIVEVSNVDGVTVSASLGYLTAGPYSIIPYEIPGNREHVPEGKLAITNIRNTPIYLQNGKRLLYWIV